MGTRNGPSVSITFWSMSYNQPSIHRCAMKLYDLKQTFRSEHGSALITAVLILMVVTVIGIIASRTADIELRIATHDKVHKMTWFATDAAIEGVVPELVEQALEMRLSEEDMENIEELIQIRTDVLSITHPRFFLNEPSTCELNVPTRDNADIVLAAEALGHADVHVRVYGPTMAMGGGSLLMVEGYHGEGKGAASGGTMILYTLRGFGMGESNSQARLANQWRHVIR